LHHIRLAARKLGCEAAFVRHRLFKLLLGRRMGLEESFLSAAFVLGAGDISLDSFLALLRCRDLGARLIDSCEGPVDPCILKVALSPIVYNGSVCGRDRRLRLRYLRFVIVVFQLNKKVSLVDLLKVYDSYFPNYPRNLSAERRKIPSHVRVVRDLLVALPPRHSNSV
jgi:hypothetical protein